MAEEWYAHTPPEHDRQRWHKLEDHLQAVADMAAEFGAAFGAEDEARLAGLLHDAGKASELFQARLHGKASGLDHWSPGAWLAYSKFRAPAASMAIAGHHVGLRSGGRADLNALAPRKLLQHHPDRLTLTEGNEEVLQERLARMRLQPYVPSEALIPLALPWAHTASSMLDVRMLYSALVDADFLHTEEHFKGRRPPGKVLNADEAFQRLQTYRETLRAKSRSAASVNQLRDELWQACMEASQDPTGLFALTAPTGTGKTLAMLGFALRHALRHGLRRIVVVVPYLTIIEQTVKEYRAIFAETFGSDFVLEHHSLAGTRPGNDKERETDLVDEYRRRQLSENWDAPIVVTTSVQLLESVFASRPSACRKLHRLARAVILFDEVQTLPLALAVATLKTLSRLTSDRYGSTVVFATATQPAFDHLDRHVVENGLNGGWRPREIAKPQLGLFDRSRRVKVDWSRALEPQPWERIAESLAGHPQSVCIVNLKRHARELAALMRERMGEAVLHLSTAMCPAHRECLVDRVKERLKSNTSCCLVSTSCIEAGVDLDFPHGMRMFADLTSIAQAAGRVNRNGTRKEGILEVVRPEDTVLYPPGAMEQAAAVTEVMLRTSPSHELDINDPNVFEEYFHRLYSIAQPEALRPELAEAILAQDYSEVARLYRLIPETGVNVLVPYEPMRAEFDTLADEARSGKLERGWFRRARPLTVSVFVRRNDPLLDALQPIHLTGRHLDEEWFICWRNDAYDPTLGLVPPSGSFSWTV